MSRFLVTMLLLCCPVIQWAEAADGARPNILLVTVDDMNCDSVGAFGCRLPETTPNIDRLAEAGLRFHHAHVQVGNCFPSRNVMLSGRYPHNTGVEGFYQVEDATHPHLVDLMKQGGYFVGIRGKVTHSTPYYPYAWDADLTVIDGQKQDMKNAQSYYKSTQRGIRMATEAGKPFCLNINISDPHKPFYAMGKGGDVVDDSNVPSRIFEPEEVPIPGFLFDHPDVRQELAHYYSSVHRADDCFGAIMEALSESGQEDNTFIMFLSDHGMPLPFAKTALWHHSTHTPMIVRWPGVTAANTTNDSHMVSAVDMLPTLLDVAGIEHPEGFDGRSFMPLIRGKSQPNRSMVYKVYNENSGGNRSPMRSVQSKCFGYLFNPWSDGKRIFKTATTGTITYRAMQKLAKTDPDMAARLKFFQHGVPEEFYDYENDPDALHNLIDDPQFADQLQQHREALQRLMEKSNDPMLAVFNTRDDAAARSKYVDRVQAESDTRRAALKKKQPIRRRQNARLFQIKVPRKISAGNHIEVVIDHRLPARLGKQKFHVTLKTADGQRIKRVVKAASATGQLTVRFEIPAKVQSVVVAAFVGEDFSTNLLHRTSQPVAITE